MDVADRSFQEEQLHIEEMKRLAAQPSPSRYKPVGYCLYCYEDVESPKLYCDSTHAQAHDRLIKLGQA